MKHLILSFFCIFSSLVAFSQGLQSPEQFLGYPLGGRFTPHHRAVAYLEHVAGVFPSKTKVIAYGSTHEARPLMVVALGSEENIKNLEQIRTDNLKAIGMLEGKPSTANRPAIVWLSYNIHGDEAVSTEAFLKVIHELFEKGNAKSEKILKNTVVILDPCLNPDGHDRYVNWYNSVAGATPNPTPQAREHAQPWPGGRFTHYLLDPNRDWAWQTQEITQQRMALYTQWYPHVHGDFHEMGADSPYYFAPAAKPYHEDISKWQRDLQDIIGDYNKKYFDQRNWLYYTREKFDLFYPSYGDTYPMYSGAIGMTYERGGGGYAGLAVERATEGDTLTLKFRIDNQAGASIATLEAIADRPAKVVEEFVKYFEKAQSNPVGFKSYVIKTAGDEGKVKALADLLTKNKIRFGYAGKASNTQGFSYLTQKDESFKVDAEDLVVSAYQPNSTMLKIFFEVKPMLEDSVTYDITSWCIPLAYGVKCYGLKDRINPVAKPAAATAAVAVGKPYAYIATWRSAEDAKFLAAVLKKKIKARAAEKPFQIGAQKYGAGTIVLTRAGNENLGDDFDKVIVENAARLGVKIQSVASGAVTDGSDFGSDFVLILKTPRVALLAGEGTSNLSVGEVWHYFEQELNYPITLIDPAGRSGGVIPFSKIDVLVVPQSFGTVLKESQMPELKAWLRQGGKLILLESATAILADKEGFGLKTKKDDKKSDKKADADSVKIYANRERDAVSEETPGSIYKFKIDNTHPLGFGYPDYYHALVNNAYNYELLKEGWNVGYTKKEKESYVAGFVGKAAKEKLNNTLMFGVEDFGRGKIVYLANNPMFRGFWYNGKLLFSNAIFMVN